MTDQALQPLGYQLVEIMGHQRTVRWVEPRLFGGVALFHVTMPAQEPVEVRLLASAWVGEDWCGIGSLVRESRPAIDQHLGAASIFRMTAITEEQARGLQPKKVEVLERVGLAQLEAAHSLGEEFAEASFGEELEPEGEPR